MFGLPEQSEAPTPAANPAQVAQPAPAPAANPAQPAVNPALEAQSAVNPAPAGLGQAFPPFNAATPAQPAPGSKAQKIREAMMTSSIGGRRNDLPLGTGQFLVKEGNFKVTPTKGKRITSFSILCVKGVEDAQGLTPEAPLYSGPKAGETYEYAIFHDTDYPNILGSQYLQVTAACMGWTKKQTEQYQGTAEGQAFIEEMTARVVCVDADGNPITENGVQVPSIVSNQAIVEITKKSQLKDKKLNGQIMYDANQQKVQQTVTNIYFNRRVWLGELVEKGLTEEELMAAFGSQEAAQAAFNMEQQVRQG